MGANGRPRPASWGPRGWGRRRGTGVPPRAAAVLLGEEVGEGLEGFAEAHVVGEDAVEVVAGEELHPAEAGELVDRGAWPAGRRDRFGGDALEVADAVGEGGELSVAGRWASVVAGSRGRRRRAGGVAVCRRRSGAGRAGRRSGRGSCACGRAAVAGRRRRRACGGCVRRGTVSGRPRSSRSARMGSRSRCLAADLEADREVEPVAALVHLVADLRRDRCR